MAHILSVHHHMFQVENLIMYLINQELNIGIVQVQKIN